LNDISPCNLQNEAVSSLRTKINSLKISVSTKEFNLFKLKTDPNSVDAGQFLREF
jgi:hypothetical protein